MGIYDYIDYRVFVRDWVASQPHRGRGVWKMLAEQLRISPVTLSQIFNDKRKLNEDHAHLLSEKLNLLELEKEYFLLLVQKDRAGSASLKTFCERKLEQIRQESFQFKNKMVNEKPLNEEAKAKFYSNWYYSAIRLACSIPEKGTVDELARRFQLTRDSVEEAIQFLLSVGLCVTENGYVLMGPKRTHVPRESPLNQRHQINWRLKGIEKIQLRKDEDMFFTSPIALSKKAYDRIQKDLIVKIKELNELAVESESEIVACLNVDLFKV